MKLHEYQGKELLRQFGVNVQEGKVAYTPQEVRNIAMEYAQPVVVKAQVHVGGRGKAGGIKLATVGGSLDRLVKKEKMTAADRDDRYSTDLDVAFTGFPVGWTASMGVRSPTVPPPRTTPEVRALTSG